MREDDENEIKLENICNKYPIIQRLENERVFCLYFEDDEHGPLDKLIIKEICDFCFCDTLSSKDCEQLSKCFLEISMLLKELEKRK